MIEEEYTYITALDVQLRESDQSEIAFILPHEHIFQNLSQFADQALVDYDNITLNNLQDIRNTPHRCNRNLNLDSVEEMHFEMQEFVSTLNQQNKKVLIVEATNNQNGQDYVKLKEIAKLLKTNIVKGFTFGKDLSKIDLNDEKTKVLFSSQNILNQVDFEFDLGTNEQKPSFVGELELSNLDLDNNLIHQNALVAYLHLSKVKKVPIIFNLKNEATSNVAKLISQLKPEHERRIVIFNPKFEYEQQRIVSEKGETVTITKVLKNFGEIMNLFKQKFIVGFDILRYNYDDLIDILKILLKNDLSKQILISNGVQYRTDLRKYGGRGFFAVFDCIKDLELNEKEKENIFRNNMLEVLQWNTYKVQIQEIKSWKCPVCNKEQLENVQRFTKFGKEFCSIPCLKKAVQ